ncbi:hypothetical protein LXL04_011257 [Taraxacum kok-saghyz]
MCRRRKRKLLRPEETGKKVHTSPVVKRLTAFSGGAHWSGRGAVKNGRGNQQKKKRWYRGGIMRNSDVSRCRPQVIKENNSGGRKQGHKHSDKTATSVE